MIETTGGSTNEGLVFSNQARTRKLVLMSTKQANKDLPSKEPLFKAQITWVVIIYLSMH